MDYSSLTVKPIGVIHTPYSDRYRAPRQPIVGENAEKDCQATLVLNPRHNFEQALADLAGFEMIWLISWLHRNSTWKPKVLPPRGPRKKRGVFATRSPHRPNPLGLSTARLLRIEGRTLHLGATDLLDGTPILDIKPYIPYADAFPNVRAGWIDELTHADDQKKDSSPSYRVEWSDLARRQAEWLAQTHGIELAADAQRVLSHDPTPHPYRRISRWSRTHSILAIKSWRVKFSLHGNRVEIERIVSGYSISALEGAARTKERLHDQMAHDDFHRTWPQIPGE